MISGLLMKWGKEDGMDNLWSWHLPIEAVDKSEEDIQRENQRQAISINQQMLLLALLGQCAQAVYPAITQAPTQLWADEKDISHAKAFPVVFACKGDLETLNIGKRETTEDGHPRVTDLYLLTGQNTPPPGLGEIAIVANPETGIWTPYSLTITEKKGKTIFQRLQRTIRDITHQNSSPHQNFLPGVANMHQGDVSTIPAPEGAFKELLQQLAQLYWEASVQQNIQPSNTREKRIPPVKKAIQGDTLIITPLPVQALLTACSNAQSGAGSWVEVKRVPTYTYTKKEGTTSLQVRPPQVLLTSSTTEKLWDQVRKLSDQDGDLFLAMLAQAMVEPDATTEGCWISSDRILEYRGIKPIMKKEHGQERRAGHRQEDLKAIAEGVSRLSNLWITIKQWIKDVPVLEEQAGTKRRTTRKNEYKHESTLISIREIITQRELHTEKDDNLSFPIPVAWKFQLGSWLYPFLQPPNKQMTWLLQQALRYDPYHETWEKRLARYFLFVHEPTITCTIGPLLKELSLPIDERNPNRTAERLKKALSQLQKDDFITEFTYNEYPELPARKWLPVWLSWTITITLSPRMQGIREATQVE